MSPTISLSACQGIVPHVIADRARPERGAVVLAPAFLWMLFALSMPTAASAAPGAFNKLSPSNAATGISRTPTVTWQVSAGAAAYEVCANLTATCPTGGWTLVGNVTSVTWPGDPLEPATTYYWQVRARDATAAITYANSGTWWHFTTAPNPPGAFGKTGPGDGLMFVSTSPTLTWGSSAGAGTYEYCYDTTNDSACSNWAGVGQNTSVALSGLSYTTTYYWHVRATNAGGTTYADGSATAFWHFLTGPPPPGAFSKGPPANGASSVSLSPTLTWGTASGATSYLYCYDTTNDSACSPFTSAGPNTSVAISGLAHNTTYYWQVFAENTTGVTWANGSSTAYFSFTTIPNPPGAFNKLSPTNGAGGVARNPTLSWQSSSGATSYEYCYDATNDGACSSWISTGTNTSVALSGLATSTTYYWHVRALNPGGTTYANGGSTVYWSFTTVPPPPGAFERLAPANGTSGASKSPALSWGTSSGATSYQYCYDTTNDNACGTWTSAGTNTSAALDGLASSTTYYWHVRASNAGGTTYAGGSSTAFWSFTTVPDPPSSFSKSSPANGASEVSRYPTLRWNASGGADHYEYCIDVSNNDACDYSWHDVGASTSYALGALPAAETFYWQVRAVNAGGTTYANAGSWWSFTTETPPAAFGKASPTNGATGLTTHPTLTWGTSANATGYEVCYDTSDDYACDGEHWADVGMSTSTSVSSLPAGAAIYWQVRARNANGTTYANGGWWSFTTLPTPGSFSRSGPANGATGVSRSPALSWTASAYAAEYEYCYDTTNDNACSGWTSVGDTDSASLSGLASGTTYYWHVRARNINGTTYANGSAASYWSFTSMPDPPGVFTKLTPANGSTPADRDPVMSWSASPGADSYEFCLDTSNDNACAGWVNVGGQTTMIPDPFQWGVTYYWHVRAVNAGGATYADGSATAYWHFTPTRADFSSTTRVAAGDSHACALTAAAGVECWGGNSSGQLGDGSTTDRSTPAAVAGLASGVVAVVAGATHTCALTDAGSVLCWGSNAYGQLGDGTTTNRMTPVPVSGLGGVMTIEAGYRHTCALTDNGAVLCWGWNASGQLGDGTTTSRLTRTLVTGLGSDVAGVAAGRAHTCALTAAGGVVCWGYNGNGQLGDGTTTERWTPVGVSGLASGAAAVTAGAYHTCALTTGGGVFCWGMNTEGELGDGTTADRRTPGPVTGLEEGVAAVLAGDDHTCALTAAGGVQCWGDNVYGQLGDGTTTDRATPVPVTGLTNAIAALAAGRYNTCAVSTGGTVTCWGSDSSGALGDGAILRRPMPIAVWGLGGGRSMLATGTNHTCAGSAGAGVSCWGSNDGGQLGDGSLASHSTPAAVAGLGTAAAMLTAGGSQTCALTAAGAVLCWGGNYQGEVGDGTTTPRTTPVGVVGLASGALAVSAGAYHTCALSTGGAVSCWGNNDDGQLGDGTMDDRATPVAVQGLGSGATAVESGRAHTCAVAAAGGAVCWGDNSLGQLGDGTTSLSLTPVSVAGLAGGVTAVTAGDYHSCALTAAGGVACWGYNGQGQLGDGTTTQRLTPVSVAGLETGVAAVSAGRVHTCALTADGRILCWGYNGLGQLGDGTTASRLTPTEVVGLAPGSTSVQAGYTHTCALSAYGSVWCWGADFGGQLGVGTRTLSSTPVAAYGRGGALAATYLWQSLGLTSGGTKVTISGAYFLEGATVTFGGVPATTVVVVNAGTIVATTGPHEAGLVDVVVYNPDGSSSTLANAFTYTTAPGVFGKVSPASGSTGVSRSPVLSWGASSGAASYAYCYDTTNDGACSGWTSAGQQTSALVSGLAAGTTYYWQVAASAPMLTTYADGGLTSFWSFTTEQAGEGFSKKTPANGATGVSRSLMVYWGASPGAASYHYCYDTTDDNACSQWISAGAQTNALVSGLAAGTTYYWQVAASYPMYTIYADGGTFHSFTTAPAGEGFGKLAPANGAAEVPRSPVLSWGPSPGAASYHYCYDTTNDNACSGWTTTYQQTIAVVSGLAAGTTYYWQVAASYPGYTIYADGGATDFWTFTTSAGAPVRGDFTGDLKSDILWRHATGGDVWLWPMDGGEHTAESYVSTVADLGWEVRGVGDQTGDGQADLLWRHTTTGELYLWTMDGSAVEAETYVGTVDLAFDIVGTGDYDGDGKSDILWRHQTTGELWLWRMNGAATASVEYVDTVDLAYEVQGSGDLNGDGKADLVWQHATAGDVWVWLMNGATPTSVAYVTLVSDLAYRIVGVADYTGDGQADLLWHHATRGEMWLWQMEGTAKASEAYVGAVPDVNYRVMGTGDYDGDGTADILWHHATAGDVWVWLMNGAVKVSEHNVGTVPDTGYRIIVTR